MADILRDVLRWLEGMRKYIKRRGREAIEKIVAMFMAHLDTVCRHTRRTVDAAWRHTVEMWLLKEKIITVSQLKSVIHLSVKSVS